MSWWGGCVRLIWWRSLIRMCRSSGSWRSSTRNAPPPATLFQVSLSLENADARSTPPLPDVPGLTAGSYPVDTGAASSTSPSASASARRAASPDRSSTASTSSTGRRRSPSPPAWSGCWSPRRPTPAAPSVRSTSCRTPSAGIWSRNGTTPPPTRAAPPSPALRGPGPPYARRPALIGDGFEFSYADLDARANALAHELIAAGVGPEDFVALLLPRSADLIVSLLAVVKAGAAYTPIDPAHPDARIGVILEGSRAVLVLTDRDGAARVGEVPAVLVGEIP
ncbi:AMP-binding protein [Streptomyces sp. M10(2022)]